MAIHPGERYSFKYWLGCALSCSLVLTCDCFSPAIVRVQTDDEVEVTVPFSSMVTAVRMRFPSGRKFVFKLQYNLGRDFEWEDASEVCVPVKTNCRTCGSCLVCVFV